MAKPKRDARGRFVKKSTARRKTTRRKAPARRRKPAARRRAPARRNPPRRRKMPDVIGMFTQGTMAAAQVLVGKAAARSVPDLVGLPKQGNVGLATQAGVALAIGYVADMFLSRQTAAAILAGALTAPLETFIVAQNVPWLSTALSPTTASAEVAGYMGRYPRPAVMAGVSRYPQPALVAGYPQAAEGCADEYAAGVY